MNFPQPVPHLRTRMNTRTHAHTHTPLHCLADPLLSGEDEYLRFTCLPFRLTCYFLRWLLHLFAVMLTLVQHWQKQSRWVGWTPIFWWLTLLSAIWVRIDFVHRLENCRLLKLSPLFTFYLIYLLLFGNPEIYCYY